MITLQQLLTVTLVTSESNHDSENKWNKAEADKLPLAEKLRSYKDKIEQLKKKSPDELKKMVGEITSGNRYLFLFFSFAF